MQRNFSGIEMEIRKVEAGSDFLQAYARLFATCFPSASHLSVRYLEWLYAGNPCGGAIGYDAWDGPHLAAHYVCIPVAARAHGKSIRVMLSLNTATHPDYQGRGLFTKLAEATYQEGAVRGISAVYGVANANSTPGFLRKLEFSLVKPLDALIGVGRLGTGDTCEAEFHREWDAAALHWRLGNPERPYRLVRLGETEIAAEAKTGTLGVRAWDEISPPQGMPLPVARPSARLRLHLGLRPAGSTRQSMWTPVPQRLRASPLNLIFRPLKSGVAIPSPDAVRLGQLDFDAF